MLSLDKIFNLIESVSEGFLPSFLLPTLIFLMTLNFSIYLRAQMLQKFF